MRSLIFLIFLSLSPYTWCLDLNSQSISNPSGSNFSRNYFDFGSKVAIEDDIALISSPYEKIDGKYRVGVVYEYKNQNGIWLNTDQIFPTSRNEYDGFGSNIALLGNLAAITYRNGVYILLASIQYGTVRH